MPIIVCQNNLNIHGSTTPPNVAPMANPPLTTKLRHLGVTLSMTKDDKKVSKLIWSTNYQLAQNME